MKNRLRVAILLVALALAAALPAAVAADGDWWGSPDGVVLAETTWLDS